MRVGIDASNIRTGGGKNQLENFINISLKENNNISFVLVSNKAILSSFNENPRVTCCTNYLLNSYNFLAFFSQIFYSKHYFQKNQCDYVFVPGGIFLSHFKPFFVMSQNMLPFDNLALLNFPIIERIKFLIMKFLQLMTFNKSNGIIFLSKYASETIIKNLNSNVSSTIIPHGINQQGNNLYKFSNKSFEILYVSDFLPYKYNYNVVLAVSELITEGYDIRLNLIGRKDKVQSKKIDNLLNSKDIIREKINVSGSLSYSEVVSFYKSANLFLFASVCENLPFIILEAMSFGLPIISSNNRPMSEIIFGEDIYFESKNIKSIKSIILKNMNKGRLERLSMGNFSLSKNYQWEHSVSSSLDFFNKNLT